MSSVQAFPLHFKATDGTHNTYTTTSGDAGHTNTAIGRVTKDKGSGYVTLNNTAKDKLFPNSTAHPTRIQASWTHYQSASGSNPTPYSALEIAGSEVKKQENKTKIDVSYDTSDTSFLNGVNSNSVIRLHIQNYHWILIGGWTAIGGDEGVSMTLYFNCYDFSATAGTGVTSASVSSSTGYGGAGITFSCVIPTGYVFDGWYKAGAQTPYSTDQSFTYTIPTDNAANYDLALTAKAHQETHSVTGTYNGSTKAILTGITGDVAVGYNSKSATLNTSSTSHTLSCANKVMRGNVAIGSASLATSGKIMKSDLVLKYE